MQNIELDPLSALIEQLLKPAGIHDERVLDAFRKVPMAPFLLPEYQSLAYSDAALPIGQSQVMNSPREMGVILQALDIQPSDRILEVGTGSGYWTAVLASLGHCVFSIDIEPLLQKRAAKILKQQNLIDNVVLEEGNGCLGWHSEAPFDVIILTGSLPRLPFELHSQLNPGGRLWAVVGVEPVMQGQRLMQEERHHFRTDVLFETYWPPLQGFPHETIFEL